MNIIFLDIDGPMRSGNSQQNVFRSNDFPTFDPAAIRYLNFWCKYADAKIVFSTSWTLMYTMEQIQKIMEHNHLNLEYHQYSETPKKISGLCQRHSEILDWLEAHDDSMEGGKFLVVDDNNLCRYIQEEIDEGLRGVSVKGGWVNVDFQTGLTYENFVQGCDILDIDIDVMLQHHGIQL